MILRGGRKYTVVLLALVGAFILAIANRLSDAFALVVSVCVGAYMGAHAVQDYRNGAPK